MGFQKNEEWDQKRKVDTVFALMEGDGPRDLASVAENTEIALADEYKEGAAEYVKNYGKYMGVSTGYPEIDRRLGSLLPGELLTIGGDTGHGKSLLAQNIAYRVYKTTGRAVLFVTLEMTKEQTLARILKIAEPDNDVAGLIFQRASSVSYRDIDILIQKAKELDCCLVIIDHLHFFPRGQGDNQRAEISRITKHFKECAVEQKMPVILLSHIRRPEHGKKADLHNLKESSSIEQDSDMVAFVHRDDALPQQMQFYMRKNRSRKLIPEPMELIQKDWKLEET
jgi:replicative DNA helicase